MRQLRLTSDRKATAVAGLVVALAACAGGPASIPPGAQQVRIVLTTSEVRVVPASVRAGDIYFVVEAGDPATGHAGFAFVQRQASPSETPGPLSDDDVARLAQGDYIWTAIEGGWPTGTTLCLVEGKYAFVIFGPGGGQPGDPPLSMAVLDVGPPSTTCIPTSPSPTSTSAATPVPSDLAALGATYLAIFALFNKPACAFETGVWADPNASPNALRQGAGDMANATLAYSDALQAEDWPSPLDEDVRAVVEQVAMIEAAFRTAAAASDDDVVFRINDAVQVISDGRAAANLLREDLGLPSVGGGLCS